VTCGVELTYEAAEAAGLDVNLKGCAKQGTDEQAAFDRLDAAAVAHKLDYLDDVLTPWADGGKGRAMANLKRILEPPANE